MKASRLLQVSTQKLVAAIVIAACCPCNNVAGGAAAPGGAGESAGAVGSGADVTTEAHTWKSVRILGGGFVTGIVYSEAEKGLVYARTDIGGAYRFDPANKSWIPLMDHIGPEDDGGNYLGIETLAADPVDANRVYMAVGTYTQDWAGTGAMMRSNDKGATWELTPMSIKMGGNENGRGNGERMAVDPNLNSKILFGTRKYGLYKSENFGKSWEEGSFPEKTEPLGVGITFVVFDKQSGTKGKATPSIYAGFASTEHGLYHSTDAGASWKPVPGQPKGVMPSHAEFDADGTLYLSYGNLPGPSDLSEGGVWKYEPKANKWTDITPIKPQGEDKFGYGGLSVLPSGKGTVMVTTIDRWSAGDEIIRTTDGGKTWHRLGDKAVRDDAGAKYLYWGRDPKKDPRALSSTGWMADIAIDPFDTNRAMYVTGQGIWATEDASQAEAGNPTHWRFENENLEETAIKAIVSPPTGPDLLSVMGDICGFRHDKVDEVPALGMFENPIHGNGTSIDFAQSKPDLVVRVGGGGNDKAHGAVSEDGGKTWTPFKTQPKSSGSGVVSIAADGSSIVWAPKDGAVSLSVDHGKSWKPVSGVSAPAKLPDWAPPSQFPASDRVNAKKFYLYDATNGSAHISEDGGATFTNSETALPAIPEYALTPVSIKAVPGHEGHVWISTGKDLYRSMDGGKTFDAFVPITEAQAVGFGKPAEGKDYPAVYIIAAVNEVQGIFRSDDGGENWVRINDDQHRYATAGFITGDPKKYGRVYVGTHGRGILYADPQ